MEMRKNYHVDFGRHMTRYALRPGRASLVEVVGRCVEPFGRMAMGAERVPGVPQPEAVGVVAVTAGDASTVHLALQKRPVFIHLILDLAIGIIEALLQQRGTMGIHDHREDYR